MRDFPLVPVSNSVIPQGKVLGYVGHTGIATGDGLHFGVVYNNESKSTTPQLAKVIMEGKLLKSYQTECTLDANGKPITWNRYYDSSNTPVH